MDVLDGCSIVNCDAVIRMQLNWIDLPLVTVFSTKIWRELFGS